MSAAYVTRKPFSLKALLTKPKSLTPNKLLLLRSPRRAGRFFLSLLAIWLCFNFSRLLPSLSCFHHHFHLTIPRTRDPLNDEFLKWSHTGTLRARPCMTFSESYLNSSQRTTRHYMMVVVTGGLNQQRNQIADAVVIARILGAVLVLPVFQVNQVWRDESEFADLFDERHFKESLSRDVAVVSSLPSTHLRKRRVKAPLMPLHADEDWVRAHYLPKLHKDSIFVLQAFDSRLSKDLNIDLQKLRCKVAFEALKFQPWIEELAERLIRRMGKEGSYMALHLRLEKDVWVRSGCPSGLGKEEDLIIEIERATKPKLLTSRSNLTAQELYLTGHCPLNAVEIARMLKALGVQRNTHIYWAGGEPFGGTNALKPIRSKFYNLSNKWNLAKPGELDNLKYKQSILAALDYIICLKSQVFMANHGGNMARSLQGHRTYMGYGKNITPSKKLLVHLFMKKGLSIDEMEMKIKQFHSISSDLESDRKINPNRDVIAVPIPTCLCRT